MDPSQYESENFELPSDETDDFMPEESETVEEPSYEEPSYEEPAEEPSLAPEQGNESSMGGAELVVNDPALENLPTGEEIESAFAIFRDKWIFTNKRLILLDVQGISGSKREYMTIPYRSIDRYCVETAGSFDDDCEMKIWIKGMAEPIIKEFSRKIDVKGLQRALSIHVL